VFAFGTPTSTEGRDRAFERLAATQFGVFSRTQALALGYTASSIKRRLQATVWRVAHRGIYRLPTAPESWQQRLMVACLVGGEHAYASHGSAAALWRLEGFEPGPLEVSTSRRVKMPRGVRLHRVRGRADYDVQHLDPFVVSTVTRTLIDVAATETRARVESALDDALRRRATTLARIRWRLDSVGAKGLQGAALVRSLVNDRGADAAQVESALEQRFLALLSATGLPKPRVQYTIAHEDFHARVDFAYPAARVVIEVDGYKYHSGRLRWERDLVRRNRLESLGWRVLNVTREQLDTDPAQVTKLVAAFLPAQGSMDA
jgi:very-short-patch-repair endonuclease